MVITVTHSPVFLFNCLDSYLKDDILCANPGREVTEMTEVELTDAIKSLAVKIESKLVHRIRTTCWACQQPPHGPNRNSLVKLILSSNLEISKHLTLNLLTLTFITYIQATPSFSSHQLD